VTEHYDAIIVGSGAGGGTLAHTLARSGKRILLPERGDFLTRDPALTAMANAIRVGEHLLSRMS
jgi:2-polyprenyl-6-methoxyphenol hydroxylase-like FAD-dependent oxidoreductase